MIRMMWTMLAALLLSACGSGAPIDDASVDVGDLNRHVAAPTVAEVLARGNDAVATVPVPVPVGFDHLGTWAATPASCRSAPWRFTRDGASAAGETDCRTRRTETVSRTSTRLELACTADGFATIEAWALNLHDNGSMSVARSEGGNGVPRSVTLRRCGQRGERPRLSEARAVFVRLARAQ